MKSISALTIVALFLTTMLSCNNSKNKFDASGTFEAEETIISSEASGTILQFDLEEGETLKAGQTIGYVDSIQLFLKKKQLEAQINAMLSKKPNISTQLAALQEQLKSAEKEQIRITGLAKADAATQKQVDEINGQVQVIKKQIEAQKSFSYLIA
jgi:HlyD family secretion protein